MNLQVLYWSTPDKEGQMYHVNKDNLYLIPTAEVPITNIYRNSLLDSKELPIALTGYTPVLGEKLAATDQCKRIK